MKKEQELLSDSYVAQLLLLSYQIPSLHWNEISRVDLNTMLQLCESLRIDIQAKLVSHQRSNMT